MKDSTVTKFEDLVSQTYNKVHRFAYNLCHNAHDAEDLVQEAYLRACKNFDNCRDYHTFENWVLKILKNVYVDLIRSRNRRAKVTSLSAEIGDVPVEDFMADSAPNAEDIVMAGVMDEYVAKALESLTPEQRDLVWSVNVEDRPYEQIAKKYQIPLGTVRSRVHRASKVFRGAYYRAVALGA